MSATYAHHVDVNTEVHGADLDTFKTVVFKNVTVGKYTNDNVTITAATTSLVIPAENYARMAEEFRRAADFLDGLITEMDEQ